MIVRRKFGLVEVAQLIPVVRDFKIRNPDKTISVETDYPEVFEGNTDVGEAAPFVARTEPVLRLDGVEDLEEFKDVHLMDAFAFSLLGDSMLSTRRMSYYGVVEPSSGEKDAGIVVSGSSHEVVCSIVKEAVTNDREHLLLEDVASACANIAYLHGVISRGRVFIGEESDHLAIAMMTEVPIVAVMSPERARLICPFRRGVPFHVTSDADEAGAICRQYL